MTTERLQYLREEYSVLSHKRRMLLRKIASRELKENNPELEEIGSSDVSVSLFNLREELGSWDEIVYYGMDRYGIAW